MSARVLIALALIAAACGDNSSSAIDANLPPDARRYADAGIVACAADAGCPPGHRSVCDRARGACVECAIAADCAAPAALGPTCDAVTGDCTCAGDADCVGRASGPICQPIERACTCSVDGDCRAGATCQLDPYLGLAIRTCQPLGSP